MTPLAARQRRDNKVPLRATPPVPAARRNLPPTRPATADPIRPIPNPGYAALHARHSGGNSKNNHNHNQGSQRDSSSYHRPSVADLRRLQTSAAARGARKAEEVASVQELPSLHDESSSSASSASEAKEAIGVGANLSEQGQGLSNEREEVETIYQTPREPQRDVITPFHLRLSPGLMQKISHERQRRPQTAHPTGKRQDYHYDYHYQDEDDYQDSQGDGKLTLLHLKGGSVSERGLVRPQAPGEKARISPSEWGEDSLGATSFTIHEVRPSVAVDYSQIVYSSDEDDIEDEPLVSDESVDADSLERDSLDGEEKEVEQNDHDSSIPVGSPHVSVSWKIKEQVTASQPAREQRGRESSPEDTTAVETAEETTEETADEEEEEEEEEEEDIAHQRMVISTLTSQCIALIGSSLFHELLEFFRASVQSDEANRMEETYKFVYQRIPPEKAEVITKIYRILALEEGL